MILPLNEFGTATLDSSGAGTARIGPQAHGVLWQPEVVSIRMTGDIPSGLATCFVYAGDAPVDTNFVDATYDVTSASTGNASGLELRLGQYIFAVWSGGNANASVTVSVVGSKEIN